MQILHDYWPSTFTSKLNTASESDCIHSNTQLLMERNETYVVLEKTTSKILSKWDVL